jgi:hypothetical protein
MSTLPVGREKACSARRHDPCGPLLKAVAVFIDKATKRRPVRVPALTTFPLEVPRAGAPQSTRLSERSRHREDGTGAADARIAITGPDLPVGSPATTGLALLLHEFATNAAKYGALRQGIVRLNGIRVGCGVPDSQFRAWQIARTRRGKASGRSILRPTQSALTKSTSDNSFGGHGLSGFLSAQISTATSRPAAQAKSR